MSVDSEYSDAASQPDHEQDHEQDGKPAGSDSDDNVPLAQRLPNALKAQQSIRAKDKQDRQRRRAERAARKATAAAAMPALPTSVPAQRAVSAPMQGGPPNASGSSQRQRQASQPLSSASAFSPPRAIKTVPPTQQQLGSGQPDFADDLTRRLAQVQSSSTSTGLEDGGGAHFGVALALDNTGAAFPRSPPATQGAFPASVHRAPPPDAFRSHAELQLRRQSSQPHLTRHSRLSSRSSFDTPAMRPPSPGANPDAKLRAYAAGGSASLSRAGSVSARGTYVIPPPRPESRSRPPSPPTHPPLPQAISQPQPVQPQRAMPAAHSRAASPARRPTTADGERHRPSELRRPMTADRDAEPRPFGAAISRPGSPVLRPPSPSMSSLTPDERLKQLAMSRKRTVSVSHQQQSRPAETMPAVPLIPLERISPPVQEMPASPRPGAQERVAFPAPPNGVMSQSLSRATATPAHKDAALGIRPPSPSMATLSPDERLRQIAMSRGRGPAPGPAQPSAPSSAVPFRKRAMSLGRPSAKEEAAPTRAKTLLSKSRGAHIGAAPMPPIPQSPLPPMVKISQNQKPVIVTDAMGATQQVLAADVTPAMRAKDVLAQLASQLPTGSVQGWMLYEICNDLGLERPIREFELVAECCARWPAEGNTFAVRQTRLSRSLAQSAIPSVAPQHGAYVEFEVKRGKWSKRWLELRENCLWVSKKEHGKDAAFLCSLSNFDVYSVTRSTVKPPRYAFTLRSTDDLSMFENPADSVHGFCSPDTREGERWIEHIMVARSCVLFQERTVLFRSRDQPPASSSTNPRARPPAAPLLNVRALAQAAGVLSPSPISASSPRAPDMRFEPGSLLARAAAAERV
ncbi:hypothetical protein AURDEDRAFT_143447 [Auricularia subglabra TFB-10046 SS5]|nr:hypothetical protein AURDEDRAFT_143447 [Auricularia subglabra TFB-10046 SS5]